MTNNLGASGANDLTSERERLLGQRGCVVWFTGLSGSGKSTTAHGVEKRLIESGRLPYVLDGDLLRSGLSFDLDFSPAGRIENIRRTAEVAALFADAGLLTLVALISPYRQQRDVARQRIGEHRFFEVFLDVSLEICEQRDPKGLYQKAREGAVSELTGVSAPYEPPVAPSLILPSHSSVEQSVEAIVSLLSDAGMLTSPAGEPSLAR